MASKRQALLLSSSSCHGYELLQFAKKEICSLLLKHNIRNLIFVPYAKLDHNAYTDLMKSAIEPWGINVTGLHTYPDPADAINSSKAIFVGGGNTFMLLTKLYEKSLIQIIRDKVHKGDLVYIGSSAGTNVATKSIHTTNDMPIMYPPTFEAIGVVPFNINPHYVDTVDKTHKGETRDERIYEYLDMPYASPVLGLREGAILKVDGNCLSLKGIAGAVMFDLNKQKTEYPTGADVSCILKQATKEKL